jgi:hypothetical protein
VLTRPERLVAVGAAGVLLAGLVGTSYADPEAPVVPAAQVVTMPTPARSIGPVAPTAKPSPAATPKPTPVAARAAAPAPPLAGCPIPTRHPTSWTPKPLKPPHVADAALPPALARRPKATDLSAITGKGIWVTNWQKDDVDVAALVKKAKAAGLTSIWVRSGGSRQGYYGGRVLPALVPAAPRRPSPPASTRSPPTSRRLPRGPTPPAGA